ncbi:MAG: histidine--tRNA ligase [Anaerolineales bacterium]|nr:histidine--tRNA ligase [Anaerolineales bacterium]
MKSSINAVKGTRDFYPEQMLVRNWLYNIMRRVSESFGYQEFDGPFLEYIDLYAAKSGDELVKEQSFIFQDRGGDWITLRPELTPSLARMVARKQHLLAYPLRWWSFGPMWRYERPQKGRSREFYQWNIDLIGVESPESDAELVGIAGTFLRETGLTPQEVQILVNNRRLVDSELKALNIHNEQKIQVFRLIDRYDKMSAANWESNAVEIGLKKNQINILLQMINDDTLWQKSEELCQFFAAIEVLGVREYVHYSPRIIRGLDYYTGTVFEAHDRDGDFRAFLGGGRYDNLVADVGGEPLSGIGFAMGDVVTTLVLEKFKHIPPGDRLTKPSILVTVFNEESFLPTIQLASELRRNNLNVIWYPRAAKLEKQLKYANQMGFPLAIIWGPDEQAVGKITVKDLRARQQFTIPHTDLLKTLRNILAEHNAS